MLIYLYGPDTFRSREQLKKMIDKFKADRDPQGLNVVILDCQKEDYGVVMEQILATPFLAERRMVVLENLLSATGKKELQEEIFSRIEENKIPETNILLFWEGPSVSVQGKAKPKTDISKKLHVRLSKEKFAQEFNSLTGAQLGNWIKEQVVLQGGTIELEAVQYMVANVGSDTWRTDSLIRQLVSYSDGINSKKNNSAQSKASVAISVAHVQLFLNQKEDDNIFNLVDALVAGQTKRVYAMIREQYAKGEDAQFVFAMLLRQFRILLELRDIFEREDNLHSDDLAKRLGLHPFVVKKSLPFVKRYTCEQLKNIYNKLLHFDIQTKTGGGEQPVLLDILVGKVAYR